MQDCNATNGCVVLFLTFFAFTLEILNSNRRLERSDVITRKDLPENFCIFPMLRKN